MKVYIVILISSISLIFISLEGIGQKPIETVNKSSVLKFNYGGWGDTIYAFLGGRVFTEINGKRTLLDSVKIKVTPNPNSGIIYLYLKENPNVDKSKFQLDSAIFYTDSLGIFSIPFLYHNYKLIFSNPGYQTIILKNYEAHPDQFSSAEILLIKDTGFVEVDVSKKYFEK
jgi:hypothetical protein